MNLGFWEFPIVPNSFSMCSHQVHMQVSTWVYIYTQLINCKSSFPYVFKDWSRIPKYVDEMWSQFAKGLQKNYETPHELRNVFSDQHVPQDPNLSQLIRSWVTRSSMMRVLGHLHPRGPSSIIGIIWYFTKVICVVGPKSQMLWQEHVDKEWWMVFNHQHEWHHQC
jgi:hypothetical protein